MPYPLALVITLGLEVPIYLLVFHVARLLPGWRGVVGAVGVNLVTHPVLWLVLSAHPGWFLPAEACVYAVEGVLLWLLARRRDGALLLVTAVVVNTASIGAGVLYGLIN